MKSKKKAEVPPPVIRRLFPWLGYLTTIQKFSNSEVISQYHQLISIECGIWELIRNGRANNIPWIWSYETIDVTAHDKDIVLPSIDLARHFGLNDNNDLPEYFEKHGIGEGIDWDTESGAWYPKFKTLQDAKNCIDNINELFDKLYLKL